MSRQHSDRAFANAFVLTFSMALAACDSSDGETKAAAPPLSKGVAVVVDTVRSAPFGAEIRAVGTAFANQSIDVTSKVANTIVALRFAEGARVAQGAVLVEFDAAQAEAEVAIAEAAVADSERQYRRSTDLFQREALSQANLDQLEATLKSNRARLAAARARLNDTVIRAPFAGRLGFQRFSVGSFVTPGDVITTLDDTSIIKLDFTVPEPSMPYIEPGLTIMARSVTLPHRTFTGTIQTIDSRIYPVTRSVTVRALLTNETGVLRPGLFMNVELAGALREAIMIPEQALVNERGSAYVFVVGDDAIASRREVVTGARQVGKVEILSGVRADERIVVDGLMKLRDGVPVRLVEPVIETPLRKPAMRTSTVALGG
jgi:membrane fusion protein, multidrug efflux system